MNITENNMADTSIMDLKKIILSLNEKITDNQIDIFQKLVSQLEKQFEKNETIISFLKMMQFLGKYLGLKKNNAHADSIQVLNSITDGLEKICTDLDLEKNEINLILSNEIQNYKSLKNKIFSKPVINDNNIRDLKAVILAMDWEISHATLENFEKVITNLLPKFKDYKIHHRFLEIIHTLGQYIGREKAKAHPDSISFLHSVFENFDLIVQTPDMPFKDKKQILQNDIKKFYEFKQNISLQKDEKLPPHNLEDEIVQPALSHIKQTRNHATDEVIPLSEIPEQKDTLLPGDKSDFETIEPALSDKKRSPTDTRDVMGELFSLKESPADEMLEAIHLLDIHDKDQGIDMLDQTSNLQPDGIKNFTPKRTTNDPIPEIGSRLDEFFNLQSPEEKQINKDHDKDDQQVEITTAEDKSNTDGIVPFQNEDEFLEEIQDEKNDDKSLLREPDSVILKKLKALISTSEWPMDESLLLLVNKDIVHLEKQWQDDQDKTCLLQIIGLIIKIQKKQSSEIQKKNDTWAEETDEPVIDTPEEKAIGLWGKIKGLFSS